MALALIVVSVEVLRACFFRRANGPGLQQAHRAHRDDVWLIGCLSLAWFASLVTYVVFPVALAAGQLQLPLLLRVAGVGLGLSAFFFLVWIHRALDRNFSSVLRIREDHTLVQSGPYRWVRHPMYAAFCLLACAYFLISANLCVGVTGAALVTALIVVRLPKEESDLLAKFGEQYQQYARGTGRVLPRRQRVQ